MKPQSFLFTKILALALLVAGSFLLFPELGFAAEPEPEAIPVDAQYKDGSATTYVNVRDYGTFTSSETVGAFAQSVLTFLMAILGGVAMLGVIAGGVMVMSGGVTESTKERGKELLIYSIVGVSVALLAMVIVTASQSFFYSLGT